MVDLQRRLAATEHDPGPLDGIFGPRTVAVLRAFQQRHGLVGDSICGPDTWSVLEHLSYHLGSRLIFLNSPMLRGEDVCDLQRKLGVLGFNAGRLDGIFGPNGDGALRDFQRNAGLASDGICGPATIKELTQLGNHAVSGSTVQSLLELEELRRLDIALPLLRIAIADPGGLASLTAALRRHFAFEGARILTIHHPSGPEQAYQANEYGADLFLALSVNNEQAEACFYEVPGYSSHLGLEFARLLAERLGSVLDEEPRVRGSRTPVLQRTRMPAVLCRLPAAAIVTNSAALARSAVSAAKVWANSQGNTASEA